MAYKYRIRNDIPEVGGYEYGKYTIPAGTVCEGDPQRGNGSRPGVTLKCPIQYPGRSYPTIVSGLFLPNELRGIDFIQDQSGSARRRKTRKSKHNKRYRKSRRV